MRCSRGDGGFRVADGMLEVELSSFGYEKEEKSGGGDSALAREKFAAHSLLQLQMAPAAFTPQKIARSSSPRFPFDAFSRHSHGFG